MHMLNGVMWPGPGGGGGGGGQNPQHKKLYIHTVDCN